MDGGWTGTDRGFGFAPDQIYAPETCNSLGFGSRNGGLPRMLGALLRYSF